jgi:MORN repeat.
MKEGIGKLVFNGLEYEGSFSKNMFHGHGALK